MTTFEEVIEKIREKQEIDENSVDYYLEECVIKLAMVKAVVEECIINDISSNVGYKHILDIITK